MSKISVTVSWIDTSRATSKFEFEVADAKEFGVSSWGGAAAEECILVAMGEKGGHILYLNPTVVASFEVTPEK